MHPSDEAHPTAAPPVWAAALGRPGPYRVLCLAFLFAVLFRYLAVLLNVLLLLYSVAVLAVLLNVVVRHIPIQRRWSTSLLGLGIMTILAAVLWFGLPALIGQVRSLSATAPVLETQLQAAESWVRAVTGLNVSLVGPRAEEAIRGVFLSTAGGGSFISQARGVLEILLLPLFVLVGALFAVGKPNERLMTPCLRLFPRRSRTSVRRVLELLGERIVGWGRGVLLGMISVGLLSYLAFWAIGVPNALLLGLISGLTEFVPLLGPWIGGLIAVVVAFLHEPRLALWTALAALAIQQFENNLIVPWAMSRTVDLHPLVTLFAVVLFGKLFGIIGVLLAIPLLLLFVTLIQVYWVEGAIASDSAPIEPVVSE